MWRVESCGSRNLKSNFVIGKTALNGKKMDKCTIWCQGQWRDGDYWDCLVHEIAWRTDPGNSEPKYCPIAQIKRLKQRIQLKRSETLLNRERYEHRIKQLSRKLYEARGKALEYAANFHKAREQRILQANQWKSTEQSIKAGKKSKKLFALANAAKLGKWPGIWE